MVRILYLDDNAGNLKVVSQGLLKEGMLCELTHIPSRTELDAVLSNNNFDLILFLLTSQAFDSFITLATLRARYPDFPIICLSDTIDDESVFRILTNGAAWYVPFHYNKLLSYFIRRAIDDYQKFISHKKAEESEKRLIAILEETSDLVGMADMNGNVLYVNRACRKVVGLSDEDDVTKTKISDYHPNWATQIVLDEGVPAAIRNGGWSGETAFLGKDDKDTPVSQVIICHKSVTGTPMFLSTIARDISERKKAELDRLLLEKQLQQSQKMDAIGRLAGGVAHDFNNMLTVILGYCHILQHDIGPESKHLKDITEIISIANKSASLTRQLLAFSRQQVVVPKVINLNFVVQNAEKMLRRIIGEDIHFEVNVEPDLKNISADIGQIEQVVLNLAINAKDAISGGGGKLNIETKKLETKDTTKGFSENIPPGAYTLLIISDTGCGMNKETISRIFEPFFTTKLPEKGTGLGLSTVYGIVKQNNGFISVFSELNKGTTFTIYFPSVETTFAPVEIKEVPGKSVSGTENILLVEDEETIRRLFTRILTENGYKVFSASNGVEALNIYNSRNKDIHLVLTDIVMPSINGHALGQTLKYVSPGIKIIYMSGYIDSKRLNLEKLSSDTVFLQKPISTLHLLDKVRQVLDSKN